MSEKKDYRSSLNLFDTDFPIRADFKNNDPIILDKWKKNEITKKIANENKNRKKFILHDGPPYANGNIHLGHAYNKILKDIVAKYKRMIGYYSNVTPGWDCNGLPIEQKVTSENPNLTGSELIRGCFDYAKNWISIQMESFKSLGVFMDWDNPYLTLNPSYHAGVMRVFADLVENGYIKRKLKTVPWCCGCQTTLAAAEIEYRDRKDPSIYVLFEFNEAGHFSDLISNDEKVYALIWTTTPWTLPLNRAVMLKRNGKYLLVRSNGKYLVFGKGCLGYIKEATKFDYEAVKEFDANDIVNLKLKHLFDEGFSIPFVLDDSVEDETGTACVHMAPGCGPLDYEIAVKNEIEIYSPISPEGKYSEGIIPVELKNKSVFDGQGWVIKNLDESGKLWFKASIKHSYPHCWRSHEPLIFRATTQCFFELSHNELIDRVVKHIGEMKFYPESGRNFLRATVKSRWEWCISRQRSCGVPIAGLKGCNGEYYLDASFIKNIADMTEKHGTDYWRNTSIEEFKKNGFLSDNFEVEKYVKEEDIFDVWVESGVSHTAVLKHQNNFPADVYLEGVDQHRGWFQSSILTSVASCDKMPMKSIITHGFTVDEHGRKMSKSLGNVVAPEDVVNRVGTDGLRLWISSIGNDGDLAISDKILNNVSEVYRKVRNTCRFILKNIVDFDVEKDGLKATQLHAFDLYAVKKMHLLCLKSLSHYKNIQFSQIFHGLSEYCSTFLSTLYFDSVKDVLYCDKKDGRRRRSVQTAIYYILDAITKISAPIMSFTSELLYDNFKSKNASESVHLDLFPDFAFLAEFGDVYNLSRCYGNDEMVDKMFQLFQSEPNEKNYYDAWNALFELRDLIHRSIEPMREQGLVKQASETIVEVKYGNKYKNAVAFYDAVGALNDTNVQINEFLEELCCVSKVVFEEVDDSDNIDVIAKKHGGMKCPRCWKYHYKEELCLRCLQIDA